MTFAPVRTACLGVPVLAILLTLAGVVSAAAQGATPKEFAWRVQSTRPQANLLHESPVLMAKAIDEMSGGRLKMNVSPAGTYVGAFEVLDAVHRADGGRRGHPVARARHHRRRRVGHSEP